MGYGPNGTLTEAEWLRTLERDAGEAGRVVSEELAKADRRAQLAKRRKDEAEDATDPEKMQELEEQAEAARRGERAARNEAERIRTEEFEPAKAALLEAERIIAGDTASQAERETADAKARLFASSAAPFERWCRKKAASDSALELFRLAVGDPKALPQGWVDEPDPPPDASKRAEALTTSYQPARIAAEEAKSAESTRERVKADKRHWLKGLGLAALKDTAVVGREDPAVVAEVISELEEEGRHWSRGARQRARRWWAREWRARSRSRRGDLRGRGQRAPRGDGSALP